MARRTNTSRKRATAPNGAGTARREPSDPGTVFASFSFCPADSPAEAEACSCSSCVLRQRSSCFVPRPSFYTRFVRNVTFRFDEDTLRRARIRALEEGTSLNAVVEEFLETWTTRDLRLARRQFVALANDHGVDGRLDERDWTRDDLYEERARWQRS